jgi:hypothetical protein
MIWWQTTSLIVIIILLWKVVESIVSHFMIDKHLPYEIERSITNGVENINFKLKKQVSLNITGDMEILINGDMFLVNNGRLCVLTKDSIHLDGKQLFMQCRKNPLLKKHSAIKREIEKNDFYLMEMDKQNNKER